MTRFTSQYQWDIDLVTSGKCFRLACTLGAPDGAIIVDGVDIGTPSDHGYVSYSAYYSKWRTAYPQLKVSRPAEDICGYCFVFANRHRYFADHLAVEVADCSEDDEDEDMDHAPPQEAADVIQELLTGSIGEQLLVYFTELSLDHPEAAASQAEEARELLLIESAKHIPMARAQQALYQACVAEAVRDGTVEHSDRTNTFVVDYGQNMEIPVFNEEQPGPTYNFSPVGVYNLGVVHHAHVYDNCTIGKHMYAHVYNEAVGKKGANNVASLIVKTLRQLNLL